VHPSSVVSFFAANDVEGFVDYEERRLSELCIPPQLELASRNEEYDGTVIFQSWRVGTKSMMVL
jgi:hypothetical protein